MKNLVLYSTSYCHLCEEAESMLKDLYDKHGFNYEVIEITNNEQLLKIYELRIPVLKLLDSDTELNWPFGKSDIELLLFNNYH